MPDAESRLESWELLDLLASLVQKSLVVYEEDEQGRGRYRLLETVRQYSRDRLLESGETEAARGRHLSFFVELGERAEPHLRGREQLSWLDRLEGELDNLRAALDWSLESDAEGGSWLAAALLWFWFFRSYWKEGSQWLELFLTRAAGSESTRARMLVARGILAYGHRDLECSDAAIEEGLSLARAIDDRPTIALALLFQAILAVARQECERATAALLESLALAQGMSDRWLQAWILVDRGTVSFREDDPAQAHQYWSEGLLLAEPVGERFLLSVLLANLGGSALYRREFRPARALLKRGLALNQELGQKGLTAHFLEATAAVIGATGQPHLAVRLLGAAEALRETLHYTIESHDPRYRQLTVTMARADLGEAEFAAAWAEGQAMSLEQAILFALEEKEEEPEHPPN